MWAKGRTEGRSFANGKQQGRARREQKCMAQDLTELPNARNADAIGPSTTYCALKSDGRWPAMAQVLQVRYSRIWLLPNARYMAMLVHGTWLHGTWLLLELSPCELPGIAHPGLRG